MRIAFVGAIWTGSNALSLANGFAAIGHDVLAINSSDSNVPRRFSVPWVRKKLGGTGVTSRFYENAEREISQFRPDVLFCFKTVFLDQQWLASLNIPVKLHYSPDDVSNSYNTTEDYLQHESMWDLIITTKSFNVTELYERGAKEVLFVWSAYDSAWHHLAAARHPETFDVGFIGSDRPDRADLLHDVGVAFGTKAVVAGSMSRNAKVRRSSAVLLPPAFGENFSELVTRVTANLVLLNSDNRDLHTCRSFEVPAAGGLVVAPRTSEHLQMFKESSEALFFDDESELFSHLDWILAHHDCAKKIALAGHQRVLAGSNSYRDRAREIMNVVSQ